jgi:hypothetical protein
MDQRVYNDLAAPLPAVLLGWFAAVVVFMGLIFGYRRISRARVDLDTVFSLSMICSVGFYSSVALLFELTVWDPLHFLDRPIKNLMSEVFTVVFLDMVLFLPCWLICGPIYSFYIWRLVGGSKWGSAYLIYFIGLFVFPIEYFYLYDYFHFDRPGWPCGVSCLSREDNYRIDDRIYDEFMRTLPWAALGWLAAIVIFMVLIFGYRRMTRKRFDLDTVFSLSMICSVVFYSTVAFSIVQFAISPSFEIYQVEYILGNFMFSAFLFLPFWLICGPLYFIYLRGLMSGRKLCSVYFIYSASLSVSFLECVYIYALFARSP